MSNDHAAGNPQDKDAFPVEGTQNIPMARVEPSTAGEVIGGSKMWWVTLACLAIAIGLVWWSLPDRGLDITIRFPEGHGLHVEDAVLFRGINVGTVHKVKLNDDLGGIDVTVNLNESATALAREGTRFWIVRPQLSVAGISGLETAVGNKYISLSPGPKDAERRTEFEGLVSAPPIDSSNPGIEIIIRGDRRYSVSPGSTVTFRGVDVGRIMSVTLSQDTRYVDIRAKIFERFQGFLTTETKFWASSGVDFDFSLTEGLKLNTESLATIAQGGISFLTISSNGNPISSGHVYELYDRPQDEWFRMANSVYSSDVELRGVVQLRKTWKQKGILGTREFDQPFNGIPVKLGSGQTKIAIPSGILMDAPKALPQSTKYFLVNLLGEVEVTTQFIAAKEADPKVEERDLVAINIPANSTNDWITIEEETRKPDEFEDAIAVRVNYKDGQKTYLHYLVEKQHLVDAWKLPNFDGDSNLWNGSPIISNADGRIIGVMIIREDRAQILSLQELL